MEDSTAPKQPNTTPPVSRPSAPVSSSSSGFSLKNKKTLIMITAGVIILFVILALVWVFMSGKASQTSDENAQVTPQGQTALENLNIDSSSYPTIITYGYWAGSKSRIESYDISTGQLARVAELPINIKKVTILNNGSLLYINNTNEQDHGSEIIMFNPTTKATTSVYTSPSSFGIDDYVISPNQQYIALWEVSFAPGTDVLKGGKSRVYTNDLSGTESANMIYDETANTPVHYPRAILDNGTVYLDQFLPNDGAGWGYGMSTSNLDGTSKQNLSTMANGTYATQPVLSPDGKYLAFAGYDGSKGAGSAELNGFRRALLMPNTVEYLDTTTNTRQKLSVPNGNLYGGVVWGQSGEIIYSQIDSNMESGHFSYNLASQQSSPIQQSSGVLQAILSPINTSYVLVGTPNESSQFLGNLGPSYSPALSSLSVLNTATGVLTPISVGSNAIQFIQAQPKTVSSVFATEGGERKQLQLETFQPKPSLEPVRDAQQSAPPAPQAQQTTQTTVPLCDTLAAQQCAVQLAASNPGAAAAIAECDQYIGTGNHEECLEDVPGITAEFEMCHAMTGVNQKLAGACQDSPLYLYGTPGTQVDVTINTEIFNAVPSVQNTFTATLENGNKMNINGYSYESVSYDYKRATQIRQPLYGTVVSKQNLAATIAWYSKKLGLNGKETSDLVKKALSQTTKPYVLMSYYNQEVSKQILPLSFNPQPDTYINYVFYFKGLDSLPAQLPPAPVFSEIPTRGQFTAVEISEIFE